MSSMRRNAVASLAAACLLLPLSAAAGEKKYEDFDSDNFDSSSPQIDNPWAGFTPGKKFVYEGTTVDDEGDVLPHRVEIHVTNLVKEIEGVRTRVSYDLDFEEGELVEAEIAFFAQDKKGNVWRLGEHPEEFEEGELVEAPTWIAGQDGAIAGIEMLAEPVVGASYSQGWAPSIGFTDRGKVDQLGIKVSVPAGTYEDVLVIAETSEEEGPDAEQLKYWARGVGNVKVGFRGAGEKTQEQMGLVSIEDLDAAQLDEVHLKALELEKSAYRISKDVYANTQPIEAPKHLLAALATSTAKAEAAEAAREAAEAADTRPKIGEDEARAIALETVPGEITDFGIERKLGDNRYVVEVVADADGAETDIIIEMHTGEVLAIEN